MILSASRRTDIPAFYSEWFMRRVEAGFCMVPNPRNPKQVARVSLRPEDVDAIVFWSKNPRPMIPHVESLEKRGFRFYFQYTLNDYPLAFEPRVPPLADRISAFKQLSQMIGAEKCVWRYDPIIISNVTDFQYHRERFDGLCTALEGYTKRLVISILDHYKYSDRRLASLEPDGIILEKEPTEHPELRPFLKGLADRARQAGLAIFSCAEKQDYSSLGIQPGSCIDGELIRKLWGSDHCWKRAKGQREDCNCVESRDLGTSESCQHGCLYCYGIWSMKSARKNYESHRPDTTAILGNPELSRPFG